MSFAEPEYDVDAMKRSDNKRALDKFAAPARHKRETREAPSMAHKNPLSFAR